MRWESYADTIGKSCTQTQLVRVVRRHNWWELYADTIGESCTQTWLIEVRNCAEVVLNGTVLDSRGRVCNSQGIVRCKWWRRSDVCWSSCETDKRVWTNGRPHPSVNQLVLLINWYKIAPWNKHTCRHLGDLCGYSIWLSVNLFKPHFKGVIWSQTHNWQYTP